MSLKELPSTIEEFYHFPVEPIKSRYITEDERASRKRNTSKRPSSGPASIQREDSILTGVEAEKVNERPKTTDGRRHNNAVQTLTENSFVSESSASMAGNDSSTNNIPCQIELTEAPKYLNEKIVPTVMKAIEQLLIKLQSHDVKEDPLLFLAKVKSIDSPQQLKPSGQFRSKRLKDEVEVRQKPKKAAPVFIPPEAIKKPKTPQEIRASLVSMGGKDLSERELKVGEAHQAEFF